MESEFVKAALLMKRKQEILGEAIRCGLDTKKYAKWLGLKIVTPLDEHKNN